MNGYSIIECKNREEAIAWTRRFPNPSHKNSVGEIEVRQLFMLDDFEQTEAVQKFRDLGVGNGAQPAGRA